MTVKELIEVLEKVKNKDLEVIIQTTDPTDWVYRNDVEYTGVEEVLVIVTGKQIGRAHV